MQARNRLYTTSEIKENATPEEYEILSDKNKRAAYDKTLYTESEIHRELKLSNVELYNQRFGLIYSFFSKLSDYPDSKKAIVEYTQTPFFIHSCNYARACFQYGANDIEQYFFYYNTGLKNKKTDICFLILDAAIRDDTTLFEHACYKILIDSFNLLMPVAVAFSAKNYIKKVYSLSKFDLEETRIGLHIACKLKNVDLLKLIIEAASKSGISIREISQVLCQPNESGDTSSLDNPLLTAIRKSFVEGVILLLSENYDINIYNRPLDSYLETAIALAKIEKIPTIKTDREEIIYHLVTHHADLQHPNFEKKTALAQAKEAKLNRILPILENPDIIKQTIFLFFKASSRINIDKNNIDIICDYISPKKNK